MEKMVQNVVLVIAMDVKMKQSRFLASRAVWIFVHTTIVINITWTTGPPW